jgi:hypothetical protein
MAADKPGQYAATIGYSEELFQQYVKTKKFKSSFFDPEARTGRTTQQIFFAPRNAVFVWCTHILDYPKKIASEFHREDLMIVGPDWIAERKFYGCQYSHIVLDHAYVTIEPDRLEEAIVRCRS